MALLAMFAHDLRCSLGQFRNGLVILRLQGASAKALLVLEMMDRQISHIARLVEDLLDVGRITSRKLGLQKERVALGSIMNTVLETS